MCGVTIRTLITEGLIAGRNGILDESLLPESSQFHALMDENGWFVFFRKTSFSSATI